MTEPERKSKASVSEDPKFWSKRTVGLSKLMAKEGELVEHLRLQKAWAKEQLRQLVIKRDDLLDVLREQGKWNEEQHGKDWYDAVVEAFAKHHREIDASVVFWEIKYADLERELIET